MQFQKIYLNLIGIEISIVIWWKIAQRSQYKLRHVYKNVQKDVFINKYQLSDKVEEGKNLWKKKEELKP